LFLKSVATFVALRSGTIRRFSFLCQTPFGIFFDTSHCCSARFSTPAAARARILLRKKGLSITFFRSLAKLSFWLLRPRKF